MKRDHSLKQVLAALIIVVPILKTESVGQAVIGYSPRAAPATLQEKSTGAGKAGNNLAVPLLSNAPFFQRGPFSIRPRISYSLLSGEGTLRAPGETNDTTVHSLSLATSIRLGEKWDADYTISRKIYSTQGMQDTTDQNASISGGITRDEWSFRITQNYNTNAPTLVETAQQTSEKIFATIFTSTYELGTKSATALTLARTQRKANPLTRTIAWTGSDWLQWSSVLMFRYQLSRRLRAGVGLQAGYDEIRDNPNLSHTQPQLQVNWDPSDKIGVALTGGIERHITKAVGASAQSNALYNTSARYSPLKTTVLSVVASRSIASSYFADQIVRTDGLSFRIQQRLAGRFYLLAGISDGTTKYLDNVKLSPTGRNDTYKSINIGVSTSWLTRGTASISYVRSDNASSTSQFTFTSNTIETEISFSF